MIQITNKYNCCGCYACVNSCPQNCIIMEEDEEGFVYPRVDATECIKCSLCEKNCPIENGSLDIIDKHTKAFAAINNDDAIRLKSSSGGIFYQLAREIINKNGIVFGVALGNDLNAYHCYVDNLADLNKLLGSKYIQSDVGRAFRDTKKFLDEGKRVLFSGTPCQIEGLINFLNRPYENLFLVDIICHAVSSSKVWRKYLSWSEDKYHEKIIQAFFRAKNKGWLKFGISLKLESGKEIFNEFSLDLFGKTFLSDICFRPACETCRFKSKYRKSDITLADFWGINHIKPDMYDDMGTSFVIVHSKKGIRLWESISSNIRYEVVDFENVIPSNPYMVKTIKANKNRKLFFRYLDQTDFESLVCKYAIQHFTFKQKISKLLDQIGLLEHVKRIVRGKDDNN